MAEKHLVRRIVMVATALFVVAGMFAVSHAEEFATAEIPAEYRVTNGATIDTTFTLMGVNGAPTPGGGTETKVKMTQSGKIDFGTIPFSTPELYEYRVTKDTKDMPGLTKDDTSYTVFIAVTNDGDVSIICKKDGTDEKPDELVFADAVMINTPECSDNPAVLKRVQGRSESTDKFTFELTPKTKNAPMPAETKDGAKTVEAGHGETKEFGTITFRAPGTYDYHIREINDGKAGYTYDTTQYDVQYVVTESNGELVCTRTVKAGKKDVKAASFEFLNTYKEKGTPTGKSTDKEKTIYDKVVDRVAKTGDSFNMVICIAMLLISLSIVVLFVMVRRLEKKRN